MRHRVNVRRWEPRRKAALRRSQPRPKSAVAVAALRGAVAMVEKIGGKKIGGKGGQLIAAHVSLVLPLFMTGATLLVMAGMYTMAAVLGAIVFGLLLAARLG